MRSLFSGVSGLQNHQTMLDVIGNNIANVNTVGFKASRVNFQDVLSQTMQGASAGSGTQGGTNPIQIGLGMGVASIDTVFTDGSFQATGKPNDLAIQGSGLFVLDGGNGSYLYTRAGSFDFDKQGNFLSGNGKNVVGWVGANGVDPNPTSQAVPIKINMGSIPATSTTAITYVNNLSAAATVGDTAQSAIDVYDSNGTKHRVSGTFTKTAATAVNLAAQAVANGAATAAAVAGATAADVATGASGALTLSTATGVALEAAQKAAAAATAAAAQIPTPTAATVLAAVVAAVPTSTWSFKPDDPTADGLAITSGTYQLNFNSSGAYVATNTPDVAFTFTPTATGGATVSIIPDFSALTQNGGETTVQVGTQNGLPAGDMQGTTINPDGMIVGRYSNGQTRNLAKVALALFPNTGGLSKVGDSMFAATTNSGEATNVVPGTQGTGSLTSGSLEMSNVDLSAEFSNMIIAERGFQANSKIISTTDEMLQELANLKR